MVVRPEDRKQFESFIEEVPYEIETEDASRPTEAMPATEDDGEPPIDIREDRPLPTLEDAERQLIDEALRRFGGNRRQTARALGISERTLYRKLKEVEEEEDSP
jgi:DNA-binding NtrC family response regulator